MKWFRSSETSELQACARVRDRFDGLSLAGLFGIAKRKCGLHTFDIVRGLASECEAKFFDRRNRPAAGDELLVGCGRYGPRELLTSGGEPETGRRY